MYFDNRKAWKNYRAEQNRLQVAGMPEEDIAKISALDRAQMKSEQRYYGRLNHYLDADQEYSQPSQPEEWGLGILDSIENPALHKALLQLKEDEQRLIFLHVVDGLPLTLIAALWSIPYETMAKRYKRAIHKLKKYF